MAELREIVPGVYLRGMTATGHVRVVQVHDCGGCLEVHYTDGSGHDGSRLVYPGDAAQLTVEASGTVWSFTADAREFMLAAEARRIALAHQFDPYLAVYLSAVEPLPHQIAAVYQELLPRQPLRFVLADDPGAGKTIMTGLYLRELILRGDLEHLLIVAPGSLVVQWQLELERKFALQLEELTPERLRHLSGQPEPPRQCIARLDQLARSDDMRRDLLALDWDVVVVDEAHKMSATCSGNKVRRTKRYELGQLLGEHTRHLLLLTATPHNGSSEDFELFMALVDPDRFAHFKASPSPAHGSDLSDYMRRLLKEDLRTFEGSRLFPGRHTSTIGYELSADERDLYEAVTDYVCTQFNRAEQLETGRRQAIGFALTILQRRLASSPEAILRSLQRRAGKLQERLDGLRAGRRAASDAWGELPDEDEYSLEELDELGGGMSASDSAEEMELELASVQELVRRAASVRDSGEDCKWQELRRVLQGGVLQADGEGRSVKLIIFTENRDTLHYLYGRIASLLGNDGEVAVIHGGLRREERMEAENRFRQDRSVRLLIATDAAGEGLNLQVAHQLINYDLPWNPNRLEQRFGRIHRVGQRHECYMWNMIAQDTREGEVLERLFDKLEQERRDLGDRVYDVLGRLEQDGHQLQELIVRAIRTSRKDAAAATAATAAAVNQLMDPARLRQLLEEQVLSDSMDLSRIMDIRADMVRHEAHKLQPHFLGEFFRTAFAQVGGSLSSEMEDGRWRIACVPPRLRRRAQGIAGGAAVLDSYERICFDKSRCEIPDGPPAELVGPGHPLMDALLDEIKQRCAHTLTEGAVLIDSGAARDAGIRLLCCLELSLQSRSGREVSKKVVFAELDEAGGGRDAGPAPHLDCRAPTSEERPLLLAHIREQAWLRQDGIEDLARHYAMRCIIPTYRKEFERQWTARLERQRQAIEKRLNEASNYWYQQANELAERAAADPERQRLNVQRFRTRARELEERRSRRLESIDHELHLSAVPPRLLGGAVIVPQAVLDVLQGRSTQEENEAGIEERRRIEAAAMAAVMSIERELGFVPRDVSATRGCGYDIESDVPPPLQAEHGVMRLIEVKGRKRGSSYITVTHNEIMAGRNCPDAFILAVAEVDGGQVQVRYLQRPFAHDPRPSEKAAILDLRELSREAELVLERRVSL